MSCRCTDLSHELPVGSEPVAAADALTAILPGIAIGRLHNAEWHLPDRDVLPFDVEFLGHHHRQCRAQALADFRLVAADDDLAFGRDLDEITNLAFAQCAFAKVGARNVHDGEPEDETARHGAASDEEVAAADR